MDDDDFAFMQFLANGDNLYNDEIFDLAAVATYLLAGISARQQERADRRRLRRLFLLRPHLMPNPRIDTPWQRLYASRSKQAFITTMGVDVDTFHFILRHGFSTKWDSLPIPHSNVYQSGCPHLVQHSLDAKGALGLVLHYLNSTMHEISLQQIFALIPTTVS